MRFYEGAGRTKVRSYDDHVTVTALDLKGVLPVKLLSARKTLIEERE